MISYADETNSYQSVLVTILNHFGGIRRYISVMADLKITYFLT
jgi:hypothetical protein